MGYFVASGGNLLWVIVWRVVVISYRRFETSYRDHLQQSTCTDVSIKY